MLKKVSLLLMFYIFASSASAQDITIHSKKSDIAAGCIKILVERLSDQQMMDLLNLQEINALSEAIKTYNDVDYGPQEDLVTQLTAINDKVMADFQKKVGEAPDEGKAKKINTLTEEAKKSLAEQLKALKDTLIAIPQKAISVTNGELKANEELRKALQEAEIGAITTLVKKTSKTAQKIKKEIVLTIVGTPVTKIKEFSERDTLADAEKAFPFTDPAILNATAEKNWPRYQVGDKISLTHGHRKTRVTGKIKFINASTIKIDFGSIKIADITDIRIREGLFADKTAANRQAVIDKANKIVKRDRHVYYTKNLQLTADKYIALNEANGYILTEGKWQTVNTYCTSLIKRQVSAWRKEKEAALESAIVNTQKVSTKLKTFIPLFNEPIVESKTAFAKAVTEAADKFKLDIPEEEDNTVAQLEEFEKNRKAQEAAAAQKLIDDNAKKKKRKKALKDKQKDNETPVEDDSGMTSIIVVVVILGLVAVIALNSKIRTQVMGAIGIGKKKKSMQDMMSHLQNPGAPAGGGNGGAPGAPPMAPPGVPPAVPGANAADTPAKTKIELSPDISIERGPDAPQAAPRKKISLSLGSSSQSNNEEQTSPSQGITPPGGGLTPPGGGLTPPGGGLTPPGGGLTPPGGLKPVGNATPDGTSDDKSNLILNPNLNGSGDKIRLKK